MRKLFIPIYFMLSAIVFGKTDPQIEIPLRFDRYYNYEEVNQAMRLLAKSYPDLCTVEVIGKSDEGREILAMTLNNPKTGKESEKPGVWVDGNIHGNEIQAAEVCLYLSQYLLNNHGSNEQLTKILDKNAFYVVPVVNVDGRAHFFNDPNTMHSSRSVRIPKDDDHDGLFDEDGYDDLDGDGNICTMHKKDPFGNYKKDPKDPRILVRVKPGEKGEYTLLGTEGIDNDGDGEVNEDAEGYLDPNRNWPGSWEPTYVQVGAGAFPLSSKSTKTVSDFFSKHPNILISWNFHNYGGMFLVPPGRTGETVLRDDQSTYAFLGKEAEKMVPGYKYMTSLDLYPTYGGTIDYAYRIHGAFGFVGELHIMENEGYKPLKGDPDLSMDQQRLKFNDNLAFGDLYKEWTPYQHPLYGEIEIGGWKKMSSRIPHTFMLNDLVHRNASAVLFSAMQTPEIALEVTKSEAMGNGLYRVNVQVSNAKMIPSMTEEAEKEKIHPMDLLTLEGKKVVASGKVKNIYSDEVDFSTDKPERQFVRVPGNSKVDYQFIVEGKGKVKLEYKGQKAGSVSLDYTIQ